MNNLTTLDFSAAWAAYLDLKDVYPTPRRTVATTHIKTIYDLVDTFDVFVLDGYGVLNIGARAVPAMPEFIRHLKKKNKTVFVLTNGASFDRQQNCQKFKRLGYDFTEQHIVSSRDAFCEHIPTKFKGDALYGVMAIHQGRTESIPLDTIILADNPDDYDRCDGFILLSSQEWRQSGHRQMLRSLKKKARPIIVVNPDITAPVEGTFTCEPGYFAYLLYRETGIVPDYYGKPFQNTFAVVKKHIDAVTTLKNPSTLMIGDTPQTDILGGMNANFQTLLMADYGLLKDENHARRLDECGIFPNYVLSDRRF